MKTLAVLLAATLLTIFASASAPQNNEHKTIVANYPIGEYAIKGDIEKQLNDIVPAVTEALKKAGDGEHLSMLVVGSADQTGSGGKNDDLGSKRAEEIAKFFHVKFPKADITALTRGDAPNSRMVVVTWTIVPAATKASGPETRPFPFLWTSLAAIALVVVVVFLVKRFAPSEDIESPAAEVLPKEDPLETGAVNVEIDGAQYLVQLVRKNGKWHTPFMTQENHQAPLMRETKSDARSAVKACLKNPYYQSVIPELVRQGKIKIKNERVV